jgi:hypothetical protein
MVKLNSTPEVGGEYAMKDGELALWMDDQLVEHFRTGHPVGYTTPNGHFKYDDSGTPYEGLAWRAKLNYGINWVKVMNYDAPNDMMVDDLVVATERIGCITAQ